MRRDISPMRSLTISVVCFVLFLICMGLLFTGCSSSSLGKGLNVSMVGTAAWDVAETRSAMQRGAHEANPVMGQELWRQIAVKSLGLGAVMALASVVEQKERPVLAHVIRVLYSVVNASVAYRNRGVK